jgi:putative FmdB family regulatory protein
LPLPVILSRMKSRFAMPIYEYICEDCGSRYERIVLSQAKAVSCPKCASSRAALQLSVFSARTKSNGARASEAAAPSGGSCACGAGGCGCN